MDGLAHIVGVVVDEAANEDVPHQVKFEYDLLEPELIDLMDDNEEHLIVAFFRQPKTFRMLTVQYFIELDVVGIIKLIHRFSPGPSLRAPPAERSEGKSSAVDTCTWRKCR
jgi:hypothetical protein